MLEQPANAAYRDAMHQWLGRPVWPTLAASLLIVTLFATAVALAVAGTIPLWLGAVVAFVCIHAGFTILHEASHRAISGGTGRFGWLDPLLGTIHAAMLLYDMPTFRFLHLRHHAHTNDPATDPDYWLQRQGLAATSFRALFVPLHYLRLYLLAARDRSVTRRQLALALLRIVLLVAILAAALVLAPLETLLLWLVPASVASVLLSVAHRMLHAAEISADRRRTTRIVRGEALWEWLICPFFWLNNHHLLHHESPRLPVLSHRRLFARMEADLVAGGARIVRLGKSRRE